MEHVCSEVVKHRELSLVYIEAVPVLESALPVVHKALSQAVA